MCVQCDQSPGGESIPVHHVQHVWCCATLLKYMDVFSQCTNSSVPQTETRPAESSPSRSFRGWQDSQEFWGCWTVFRFIRFYHLSTFKHFAHRQWRNRSALHLQVTIKAPNSEDSSYVNKKGFHSVGCQLVCNARGLLLSAETHWPGGLKDTDVLERSALHKQLQDTEEGWLLGEQWISGFLHHPAEF